MPRRRRITGTFGVSIRTFGDWARAKRRFGILPELMKSAQRESLEAISKRGVAIAVGHIDSQDLNWVPLRPSYKSAKGSAGYSTDIYTRTTEYRDSIDGFINGDSAMVGFKPGLMHSTAKIEMAHLAVIHEYGAESVKIPARPLWQPTYGQLIQEAQSNRKLNFIAILEDKLRTT